MNQKMIKDLILILILNQLKKNIYFHSIKHKNLEIILN
jgi:hypothetical protein